MSGHYYRVGVHGPPKRGQRLMYRVIVDGTWIGPVQFTGGHKWGDHVEWFPVEAPPSELAPEPEDQGVEDDGVRFRVRADKVEYRSNTDGGWYPVAPVESFHRDVRVAAALGLVDQPPVPRALVDWLRAGVESAGNSADDYRPLASVPALLRRIEAGEFGPVEEDR